MGKKKHSGEKRSAVTAKNAKRTSAEVRNSNIAKGALCIDFEIDDMRAHCPLRGNLKDNQSLKDLNPQKSRSSKGKVDNTVDWDTCLRKGLRITADTGCWIPATRFCEEGKGDPFKGYQRSFFAVHGFLPEQFSKGKGPADHKGRDGSGSISHLCHRHWCCNPLHLVFETKARNWARNSCLGNVKLTLGGKPLETCGCMLQYHFKGLEEGADAYDHPDVQGPPCLRGYSKATAVEQLSQLDGLQYCGSTRDLYHVFEANDCNFEWKLVDHSERDAVNEQRNEKKRAKRRGSVNPVTPGGVAGLGTVIESTHASDNDSDDFQHD